MLTRSSKSCVLVRDVDKRGCSRGTLDFNFFVENGLAEFLKPSQWLRMTYEAPYQPYE
jgi:hypothetical protein